MKLVIDILEEKYNAIKSKYNTFPAEMKEWGLKAIKNGTSLKEFYNSDWYEGWIPTSEKLPNTDEYVNNVCKYYLIQDEYGDMQVARYTKSGWIPMHSLEVIEDNIIAWRILPQKYTKLYKKGKSCATCLYCRDGICKDEACVGCFDDPNHSNYEERDI